MLNEKMTSVLRIKDNTRDAHSPRVKIGILDTGLDSTYTEAFRKANRIEQYHDFVDPKSTSPKDNTGHGTRIFLLMKKVYEDAEFYIGRVWENSHMTTATPKLVEQVRLKI
jgi:hypothetical protein